MLLKSACIQEKKTTVYAFSSFEKKIEKLWINFKIWFFLLNLEN